MKAAVENYKGIEFVRISKLPEDQKKMIPVSFESQKIIKILYNKELLNDCLKYSDYLNWYSERFHPIDMEERIAPNEMKLAFK
jgi:hypothetical protein